MLNEKRNVTLQAKVKFARHNGAQAPLKVVLTFIEKEGNREVGIISSELLFLLHCFC